MKRPNAWGFHDTLGNVWEVTGSFVPPVEWAGIPAGDLYLARHDDIPRSRGYSLRGGGLGSPIYSVSSVFYQQCRHDQQNIGIGFRVAWHFPGNQVPVVADEGAAEEEWLGSL
jgi:formylglycine-generating enzyme required for sulfatase activity